MTGCVALGCCTIGILFTTGAGEYWLTLFDSFGATGNKSIMYVEYLKKCISGLTFIAFTELVSVMYVYGHQRFTRDIHSMTGVRPGVFWQVS